MTSAKNLNEKIWVDTTGIKKTRLRITEVLVYRFRKSEIVSVVVALVGLYGKTTMLRLVSNNA
jgi:hypothetical protein